MADLPTPDTFYRQAIDLNRFSNGVSKKLITTYNDIIVETANKLQQIDETTAPYTATRLRSLLAQLKESLGTWAIDSANVTKEELQGLAVLQSEFVENELKKLVPKGEYVPVRTVAVSPDFAKSVVMTDPTSVNIFNVPDQLQDELRGGKFKLTAPEGAYITLPNGTTVQKAFRGLAVQQAEKFSQVVRSGLLAGDTTQQMARRLKGRLEFGQTGNVRQVALAGGELTKMANHQVMTIVRTSVNQVANTASKRAFEANSDIAKKYKYVATLDSRTSTICAQLDGQKFTYNKGPTPPQHFNCRSTIVPVIDDEWYEQFGETPPDKVFGPDETKRAAKWGKEQKGRPVPGNMTYGQWLARQPKGVQAEVLGKEKSAYFRRLSKQKGGRDALRSIVREDGSEVSLKQLKARYGDPAKLQPKRTGRNRPIQPIIDDPKKYFDKASSVSLGEGVAGQAKYVSNRQGGVVIKRGRVTENEVASLKKLQDTGVVPKFFGFKSLERKAQIASSSTVTIKAQYLTMGKAKGKPLMKEITAGISGKQEAVEMMNSYMEVRKAIHLKGIAHNDMHVMNFFYDRKTKKGMAIDLGMAQRDPKAALIEALGTGVGKRPLPNPKFGTDWQSYRVIEELELIGPDGFLSKELKGSKYARFISNRKKVRSLLKEEMDGPQLMSRNIRGRTDNLYLFTDEQALKYLKMLYEGL